MPPRVYGAGPQTWAMVQDRRGVLYTAHEGVVAEFDGVTWRTIPLPGRPTVRVLAVDANDRVYVGAHDDFGWIEADSVGLPRFHSLRPQVPSSAVPFGEVRSVLVTPEGVYFSTPVALFRWSEADGLRTWPLPGTSRRLGFLHGRVYVLERERGLLVLDGDRLVPVEGAEMLVGAQPAQLLDEDGGLLVLTRKSGLFRFGGQRVVPWLTPVDALLRDAQVFSGTRLPDGSLALATMRQGLLVLGADGHLVRRIDRHAGLRDSDAKAVLRDQAGALWVGLNNGIARLDFPAAASYFSEPEGLPGFVLALARYEGHLYAATSEGVGVLEPDGAGRSATFRALDGLDEFCHALAVTAHGLVAGCDHGVFALTPTGSRLIATAESAFSLHAPPAHPERLYVGLNSGVSVLEWKEGGWQRAGAVQGVRTEVRHLAEADGVLWIGTVLDGLYRADVAAPGAMQAARVARWPNDGAARVFLVDGAARFVGDGPLMRAEGQGDALRFVPDEQSAFQAPEPGVSHLAMAPDGSVWMHAGTRTGRVGPAGDWEELGGHLPVPDAYALFPEADGVLWVGTAEGLVRYDAVQPAEGAVLGPPLVRSVARRNTGAVLYGGSGPAPDALRLGYDPSGLRFTYSLPGAANPWFQTRLDGQDDAWSPWTTEPQRDYTNLAGGRYTFRVRTRQPDGTPGPEASITVVMQAPWYRTPWAYALYALLLGGVAYGLVRLNGARLRARNAHLEAIVQARTAEVASQNAALEAQNAQIEGQAAHLRVLDEAKSRFFANISHEFRTPLTLTLGPLDDLLTGQHGALPDAALGSLDLARRNALRLLRLVNRLLDLAKLESGHMTLQAQPGDLGAFVRDIAANFAPLAARRGLTLRCRVPVTPVAVAFDADKAEEIVVNLLANAIKATSAGGNVEVTVEGVDGQAEIVVSDTGTGIDVDSLRVIFDRFAQGHRALPGTAGTGIGLNLVQELVQLHGGTVSVESEVGAGSTFRVRLPGAADAAGRLEAGLPLPERSGEAIPQGAAPAVAAQGDGAPFAPSTADRTTVLVVDDNPDIRAYVRQQLEPDYRVEEAGDGDEGLEKAQTLLPDLVVSDVMMPRRDGFSLCRALKADAALSHVPIILLTAKASSDSRLEGLDAEADDYLTKPFDARELRARVRNLVAGRERLRERFRQEVVVRPSGVVATSTDAAFLDAVRLTIEAHLTDADFAVEALAGAVALSASQLGRRVKALTGLTPVQLILRMRLERAADLLRQGAGSVSEIAYGVGFNAHAYFAQRFREHFGVTPSAYAAGTRATPDGPVEAP